MQAVTTFYSICFEISKQLNPKSASTQTLLQVSQVTRDLESDIETYREMYNTFHVGKGFEDTWLTTKTVYIQIHKTIFKLSSFYTELSESQGPEILAKIYYPVLCIFQELECCVASKALSFWFAEMSVNSLSSKDITDISEMQAQVTTALGAKPSIKGLLTYINNSFQCTQIDDLKNQQLPEGVRFVDISDIPVDSQYSKAQNTINNTIESFGVLESLNNLFG